MKLFQTANFLKVQSICSRAATADNTMSLVVSEQGQGKTVALEYFANQHSSLCLYTKYGEGSNKHEYIRRSLDVLNCGVEKKDLYTAVKILTNEIELSGRKILIVDDFKLEIAEIIMQVNSCAFGVSVVVACASAVMFSIMRKASVDPVFAKLIHASRRNTVWLDAPRKDEVEEITGTYGIDPKIISANVRSFRQLYYAIHKANKVLAA